MYEAVIAVDDPSTSVAETGLHRPGEDVPLTRVGQMAEWFVCERNGEGVIIRPQAPLPSRCLIRPAALFRQPQGFPDVNTVMGRLLFAAGATQPQFYTPYSRDPNRKFCELFFTMEAAPDDELFASAGRWRNYEAIAHRLLTAAGVPWTGLESSDVEELVTSEPWYQPLEGCVLHALAQWTHSTGNCVIEIGSLHGKSLSMVARALRAVGSDSLLVSVDPHSDQPQNHDRARLALGALGEESRLVQFRCRSDIAWHIMRPQSASLIFIDGDHACEQVAKDFENYRELLAHGGCMAFHDYGHGRHLGKPDDVPGVRPAVDRHVMRDREFRPLLLAHTLMVFVKL